MHADFGPFHFTACTLLHVDVIRTLDHVFVVIVFRCAPAICGFCFVVIVSAIVLGCHVVVHAFWCAIGVAMGCSAAGVGGCVGQWLLGATGVAPTITTEPWLEGSNDVQIIHKKWERRNLR